MLTEVLIPFLLLLAIALLVWIAVQAQSRRNDVAAAIDRMDARLDEQGKRGDSLGEQLRGVREQQLKTVGELQQSVIERFGSLREGFEKRQAETQQSLAATLQGGVDRVQRQVADNLSRNTDDLVKRMEALTKSTDERLQQISGQVDKRLAEGFEKTTSTFSQIRERLAVIDSAQQKITELSTNVVSLQRVLADRTSRGAFGEVQLHALVANVLPDSAYRMQYTLVNGKRVDCVLYLPEPTGKVPIDSKFPLDNYRRQAAPEASEEERRHADRDFARDVQMHIDDVAAKYIIPGETAAGAILFVPAEAVFAEIHGRYPELVERAQRSRVWIASPTTLMAILTTAAAVLKDSETRKQVHLIQEHLRMLAQDFDRFQERMNKLSTHIGQAKNDVDLVNTSARKISSRFNKIEKLELSGERQSELPLLAEETDEG